MRTAAVVAAAAALLAGCGGAHDTSAPAPRPRLPRVLAHAWSREALAVAAALAANDGCGAEQRAGRLRTEVITAVNAGSVPRPLLEPLTSAVNALPAQITCTPGKLAKAQPHAHAAARELGAWLLRYSR